VADADAFIAARGLTLANAESHLLRAMDLLNNLNYCGSRVSSSQSLPFPRSGITLSDNRTLASDAMPTELINAQIWLAYHIAAGDDPTAAHDKQPIRSESVDVLSVEYFSSGNFSISKLPNVVSNLECLICSNRYLGRA
jgi:hypothetical protein